MQIVAVLALLGASLGQPDDPPDQDMPAAEQQEADTEYPPAGEQQAEQPEADTDSNPAYEQQAEQQPPAEVDSAAAGEQPGETGSDDASAGLDEANTGSRPANTWRSGMGTWLAWTSRFISIYAGPFAVYDHFGPFTIQNVRRRMPTMSIDVDVRGRGHSPEQWSGFEEQVRYHMCAMDGREFTRHGGILEMIIRDEAGASRTVTITNCG